MSNFNSIVSAKDLVKAVLDKANSEDGGKNGALLNAWRSTLLGLRNPDPNSVDEMPYGEKLLDHCSLSDFKNGVLYIETTHPGWSQILQFHRNYILTGLSQRLPTLQITAMAFRGKNR